MRILLLVLFLSLTANAGTAEPATYSGEFSQLSSDGEPCDQIFTVTSYTTKHFLVGANGLTSVLYFEPKSAAFFGGMSLIGRMGPDAEIFAEKILERDDLVYEIVSEGLVDPAFLLTTISILVKRKATGAHLCRAQGEYFGQPLSGL